MRILHLALAVAMVVLAGRAQAGTPGTLVITQEAVDTSQKDFEKTLKKAAIKQLAKSGEQWTFHFIAFLTRAPGSKDVNIAFYDQAEKSKEPTNHIELQTSPNAKIMASQVTFGDDTGLKAGHTYNVLLTRVVGGKEQVFARSTLTLK
jgi:hypothetical protein